MTRPGSGSADRDPLEDELAGLAEHASARRALRGAERIDPERAERARSSMLALMETRSAGAAEPREQRRRLLPVSIAAALLAVLAWALWRRDRPTPGPLPLGPGPIVLLSPSGEVESFGTFTWKGELPEGTSFVLRIEDRNGSVQSVTVQEPRWTPADERSLPERIRWNITIVDPAREPLSTSDSLEAWRAPRPARSDVPAQSRSLDEVLARLRAPGLDDPARETLAREALLLAGEQPAEATAAKLQEVRDALPESASRELDGSVAVTLAYALRKETRMAEARATLGDLLESLPRTSLARFRALVLLSDIHRETGAFGEAFALGPEADRSLASLEQTLPAGELAVPRLLYLRIRLSTLTRLGLTDPSLSVIEEIEHRIEEAPESARPDWRVEVAINRLDWLFRNNRFEEEAELARRLLAGHLLDGYPIHRGFTDLRLGIACWYMRDGDGALAAFERAAGNDDLAGVERGQSETRIAELLHDRGRAAEAREHLARARDWLGDPVEPLEERLFFAAISDRIVGVPLADLRLVFATFLESLRTIPILPGSGTGFLASLRRREFLLQLMSSEMEAAPGEAGILAALDDLYRAQACSTLVRTLAPTPEAAGSIEALRRSTLDDDSGLLVLFPSRRGGLVFALDGRGAAVAAIPSYPELNELRLELAQWERMSPEERARRGLPRAAAELARRLLPAEIAARMESWVDVSIVGRDLLGPFSFELLPLPGGELLGERISVGYLPSMPLGELLAARDARTTARELTLLVGSRLPREIPEKTVAAAKVDIPFDAARRRRLSGGLPEEELLVLEGERATIEALRGPAASARCWLIVAHGVENARRERTPTLLLSDADGSRGWLGSLEIAGLSAPPLAVLAACGAGAGPARPGDDGAAHLGGAFLAAGAQVVLLAPGSIDYEDVCALMPPFWSHLRAGESPAAALRSARRELREERGSDDPALGLLHVVGLAHRPIR